MVRSISVSPRHRDPRTLGVLTAFFLVFSTVSTPVLSQPGSREESMAIRAEKTLQIAQEYVSRKGYKQAEAYLSTLQAGGELAEFVGEGDRQIVASLSDHVQKALGERTRVAKLLMDSDRLADIGQYGDAVERLESIKDNEYLSEPEREQIAASLESLRDKAKSQPKASVPAAPVKAVESPAAVQEAAVVSEPKTYVVPVPVVPVAEEKVAVVEAAPAVVEKVEPVVVEPAAVEKVELVAVEPVTVEKVEPVAVEKVEPVSVVEAVPVAAAVIEKSPAEETRPSAAADAEDSYVSVVLRRQNRLRNYTKAVVDDSVAKAGELLGKKEFEAANAALDRAFSTLEYNKVDLGDELYREYSTRLTVLRNQIREAHNMYILAREEDARSEAQKMTEQIRQDMEIQRAKAVEDYLDRAFAFQSQQRYEEALGQLEQLLAIDPTHKTALIQKTTLERTIGYRTELELQREKERRELMLLRHSMKSQIPYHEEISYPKNWIELTARRKEEGFISRDPADAAVYRQLEQVVDLSMLTEETTFAQAMDVIRNAVDPPLPLVIMWNDIRDNAFIDKTNSIGIPGEGLSSVTLLTGLKRVIEAVGGSGDLARIAHVVDKGLVTVATKDYLPTEYKPIVYDVAELLSAPAGLSGMGGGYGGGMGGGMMGGMGGMGGGYGGGGGGMNYMMSMMRGYMIADIIKRTIRPETWWDEGGEGEIYPFGADKLIVSQTPEVHDEIASLLEQMVKGLGRQVSIEARFMVVDENWLEDVGLDFTLNRLSLGSHWSPLSFGVGAVDATSPIPTSITNTLTARNATNPAMNLGVTYTSSVLDDLQVSFMIKATQMHANSSMLTAPKLMVLSGDSATISINKDTYYKSSSELTTDTVTGGTGLSYGVSYWTHETDQLQTGIQMEITPVITSDKKYVLLNIQAYLTDLLGFATETTTAFTFQGTQVSDTYQLPVTEQTSIQTRVNIPDQGTVMLGGLTLAGENEIESGVPVLSKLPVFGRLFSSRSNVKDKQILLILVKPTIVLQEEQEADAVAQLEQ